MDVSLLKDEIQTLQARIEDKKQQIEAQLTDISKSDTTLTSLQAELANVTQQCTSELTESVKEKKEKVKNKLFVLSLRLTSVIGGAIQQVAKRVPWLVRRNYQIAIYPF